MKPKIPITRTASAFSVSPITSEPKPQDDPQCKFEPGEMIPVIDPLRCEAKGPCIPICPYDVLELRVVPKNETAALSLVGRFKLFVHGGKQAFAVDPDACRGCGLCVQACPEKAIKLQKRHKSIG